MLFNVFFYAVHIKVMLKTLKNINLKMKSSDIYRVFSETYNCL